MLLIGLKNTEAGGTFHGSEGLEGISMQGTIVTVLKEGTSEELEPYVKLQRETAKAAKKALSKLEDRLNREDESLSVTEYDKKSAKYRKQLAITRFDKLLLVEGKIL